MRLIATIVLAVLSILLLPAWIAEPESAMPQWMCVGKVGCLGGAPDDVKWCEATSVTQPISATNEPSANARLAELCRKKVEAENAPRAYLCGLMAYWRAKCVQMPEPGGSCPN